VGVGWKNVTKTGKNYIALKIEPEMLKRVASEDLGKVCLFKNEYQRDDQDPDYVLHALVSDAGGLFDAPPQHPTRRPVLPSKPLDQSEPTKSPFTASEPPSRTSQSIKTDEKRAYVNGIGEELPF
jgi:hypothetical protein